MAGSVNDRVLPDGWADCILGDLLRLVRGVSYAKADAKSEPGDGLVPILRATNIDSELHLDEFVYVPRACVSAEQFLHPGDIVIAASSGSRSVVGKAAQLRVPWHGAFGTFCMGLRVCSPVNPSFVGYFLQSQEYRNGVSRLAAGININNLRRQHIETFDFRLAPLPEQLRIVERIEELFTKLDAGVAALERVRANLQRYRASVLKAAVEGRLTEEWRAQHPDTEPASVLLERILQERRHRWEEEQLAKYAAKGQQPPKGWQAKYQPPAAPEIAESPDLPEGWCWTTIGECFDVQVGATPSRSQSAYWGGDVPWVSSGEVQFCRIRATRETITAAGLRNSSTKMNPAGSVLLGMIGEGRTRGQVALLDIEACNNQNCAAIRVSCTPILPEYVYFWLWSQYETTRSAGSGNNQPALNKRRVEEIPLPLPPLAEQRQIVDEAEMRLSVVEQVESEAQRSLSRGARLRQSILKRAFEGRLVPQDPADEPASVLLGRIAAGGDRPAPRRADSGVHHA